MEQMVMSELYPEIQVLALTIIKKICHDPHYIEMIAQSTRLSIENCCLSLDKDHLVRGHAALVLEALASKKDIRDAMLQQSDIMKHV